MMVGLIKHRSYKMIETTIHTYKNSGRSLFNNICFYNKISSLAYKIFSRLKPYLQFSSSFFFERRKNLGQSFSKCYYIGFRIIWLVWNFEPAAQINKFQVWKMRIHAEHNFQSFQEDSHIFYFASSVHVQAVHF